MAKKRKTRKQKIDADVREQTKNPAATVSFQQETVSLNLSENHKTVAQSHTTISTVQPTIAADYHYITKDLQKTLVLTSSVVIVEFLIHFLIR